MNNKKMNPLEYLFWLFVVTIVLEIIGGCIFAFSNGIQRGNRSTYLLAAIIITAVLLLFTIYGDHQNKNTTAVSVLEEWNKQYKSYKRMSILIVPGLIIGLFFLLGIVEEGFQNTYLIGFGICICLFFTGLYADKRANKIETDSTKYISELKSGSALLKSSIDLLTQAAKVEAEYLNSDFDEIEGMDDWFE